jgi:hypothetical protein
MRTLPTTFTKAGFNYEQITRQGDVAIYRQTKDRQSWEAFEVGRIRQNEAREAFGKQFEAAESWPRSKEWGILAYTCTTLANAQERFRQLVTNTVPTP